MAIIRKEWRTYDTLHAIDSFRSYWEENERLISKEADRLEVVNTPEWEPKSQEEHGEFNSEKEMARYFHDREMLPTFRYSCVVMLYVIVERELIRLVENLEKDAGPQKLKYSDIRGDLIEQIQKTATALFGLRLSECANYRALHDLRKVRNCIVHCHGELQPSGRDTKYLVQLANTRKGFFACSGARLHICDCCIEQFVQEVRYFFESVFLQLKWRIDKP